MPEPRPQQLITGDRAIMVLDTVSSAALQTSGVSLVTVSLATYNELVASLSPAVFPGLDLSTGLLKAEVMPAYLTPTAINELDVLDPLTNVVADSYLPTRLTTAGLTSLIESSVISQLDTDGDGTPVVIGGSLSGTPTDWAITGTFTAQTVTAGTTHGDVITGSLGTIDFLESQTVSLDSISEPGAPASTAVKLWVSSANRLLWKTSTGANFAVKNIQTVTTLPDPGSASLGDEIIIAATGEHRVYKGATLGWRLASPLEVATVTARNALTNLYDGMRVFVASSGQDHIYRTTDSKWHGTKAVVQAGGTFQTWSGVNDTNFRTASVTTVTDPGYPYVVEGHLAMEVYTTANPNTRAEVWTTITNTDGTGSLTFDIWYGDQGVAKRCSTNPLLTVAQTGTKLITVAWRVPNANSTNSHSTNYQYYNSYRILPA